MKKRPNGITIIAVLQLIFAAFKVAQYCWVLYSNPELLPMKNLILAVVFIPFQILIAYGLLRGWSWCWIVMILLFGRKALGIIIAFFQYPISFLTLFLAGALAVVALIIWYLCANKAVKGYFTDKQGDANKVRISSDS